MVVVERAVCLWILPARWLSLEPYMQLVAVFAILIERL